MNPETEQRYTVAEAASGGWYVLDEDQPERAAVVHWAPLRDAALQHADLLNRVEQLERQLERQTEATALLQDKIISLQSQVSRALAVTRMHEPTR